MFPYPPDIDIADALWRSGATLGTYPVLLSRPFRSWSDRIFALKPDTLWDFALNAGF